MPPIKRVSGEEKIKSETCQKFLKLQKESGNRLGKVNAQGQECVATGERLTWKLYKIPPQLRG